MDSTKTKPPVALNFGELAHKLVNMLQAGYWGPLRELVKKNPELIKSIPGMLLQPEQLTFYFGRTHIGMEYLGPEILDALPDEDIQLRVEYFDLTDSNHDFFEEVIGFELDGTARVGTPMVGVMQNLVVPTNTGLDCLHELGWNFDAQEMIMGLNFSGLDLQKDEFARLVNAFFFNGSDSGLRTRHIKWMDFIPCDYQEFSDGRCSFGISIGLYSELIVSDATSAYPIPEDYKFSKLPKVNRFLELVGDLTTSEPQLTSFLAQKENQFILTMRFGAVEVIDEVLCEWQSDPGRNSIKPDFIIKQSNGYGDIVEFKLPRMKGTSVVGRHNRETFSAEIQSYVAQTRVYEEYFDDPNNRRWFAERYGFEVLKPRRTLIVGRRSDFDSHIWRLLEADCRNLQLLTYDDLVDGVVAQFYK